MKIHYDLDMDWLGEKGDNRYIISVHEINLVVSAEKKEDIEPKLKKAIDGWIQAFGIEDLENSVKIYETTHREFEYNNNTKNK